MTPINLLTRARHTFLGHSSSPSSHLVYIRQADPGSCARHGGFDSPRRGQPYKMSAIVCTAIPESTVCMFRSMDGSHLVIVPGARCVQISLSGIVMAYHPNVFTSLPLLFDVVLHVFIVTHSLRYQLQKHSEKPTKSTYSVFPTRQSLFSPLRMTRPASTPTPSFPLTPLPAKHTFISPSFVYCR